MRLVLDACVLFPGRLRDILLGVAERGGFTPLWSARILEEWARATRRLPDGAEAAARFEIARLEREWPDACIDVPEALLDQLFLPDENDRHVLAAAIGGKAEGLLTLNRADFLHAFWRGTAFSCAIPTGCWSSFARRASMSRPRSMPSGPSPR